MMVVTARQQLLCLTIDSSELADLLVQLQGLKDWRILALKLGFTFDAVMKIKEDNKHNDDDCVMEIMYTWLKKGPSSTMQALTEALEAVHESAIAARIRGGKEWLV